MSGSSVSGKQHASATITHAVPGYDSIVSDEQIEVAPSRPVNGVRVSPSRVQRMNVRLYARVCPSSQAGLPTTTGVMPESVISAHPMHLHNPQQQVEYITITDTSSMA